MLERICLLNWINQIYLKKTSPVYDCTVEDVEYIYNKLSIHIFNSKRRRSHSNAQPPSCCYHNVAIVTHIRYLQTARLLCDVIDFACRPPIKRNHRCILHKKNGANETFKFRVQKQRQFYVSNHYIHKDEMLLSKLLT